MPLTWSDTLDGLDWNELSRLYEIAPLGIKPPELLKTAFTNSRFKCFVRDGEKLVGVGRALADGVDCAYLCDIAVHPDQQGSGLGRQIVERLLALCKGHKKIILYAAPGKDGYYKKFGFRHMNTAMAIFTDQKAAQQRGLIRED